MAKRLRGKRYAVVEDLGEDANRLLSIHRTRKLAELAASSRWAFVLDVDAKHADAMARSYRVPVDDTTFSDLVRELVPHLQAYAPKSDAALRKLAERGVNVVIAERKAARKCVTLSRFDSPLADVVDHVKREQADAGQRGAA